MLLADALCSSAFPTANRTLLELGAGTGLPSITATLIGDARLVVASDYDEPQLVRELRDNVRRNLQHLDDEARKRCKVVGHIWGKDTEELLDCLPRGVTAFDSVLLADCLWDPLSHADLLKTVVKVLSKDRGARVNVIAGLHTGREKVTSFIRRAYRAGLRLAEIERAEVWPSLPADALQDDSDAARAGNEALAHAKDRILELEVCGNTPIQQSTTASDKDNASTIAEGVSHDDEPRLTGNRRLFLIDGYGSDTEGDVKLRNRWLTVWSLEWASPL